MLSEILNEMQNPMEAKFHSRLAACGNSFPKVSIPPYEHPRTHSASHTHSTHTRTHTHSTHPNTHTHVQANSHSFVYTHTLTDRCTNSHTIPHRLKICSLVLT